jgi:hypothetical protein
VTLVFAQCNPCSHFIVICHFHWQVPELARLAHLPFSTTPHLQKLQDLLAAGAHNMENLDTIERVPMMKRSGQKNVETSTHQCTMKDER